MDSGQRHQVPRECALLGWWLRFLSRLGSRQHSTPLELFPFQILLGFFWTYLNNGANLTSTWEVYSAAAAKSLQSCPTLCDPIDGSHQAPPSLGFSRQEHWSGLPFPSPMHESEKWKWSRSVVSDSPQPMDCSPPGSSVHGIFQARVLEWGAIAFSGEVYSKLWLMSWLYMWQVPVSWWGHLQPHLAVVMFSSLREARMLSQAVPLRHLERQLSLPIFIKSSKPSSNTQ